MEMWGLILNTIGAVLLGFAQTGLDRTVRLWLTALDFSVETIIAGGNAPQVRIGGMERQMNRTLGTNRWLSIMGWVLTAAGFALQLIPHLRT